MTCQSLRNPVEPSSELRDTGSALVVVFTSNLPTQPPSPHQQPLLTRLIATDPGDPSLEMRGHLEPLPLSGEGPPSWGSLRNGLPSEGSATSATGQGRKGGRRGNATRLRATLTKASRELKISKLFFKACNSLY